MTFIKGKSGNPQGRKKSPPKLDVAGMRKLAQTYTVDALTTLADIMRDDAQRGNARVAAAEALLSRGWGRAPIALSDENGAPMKIDGGNLLDVLKRLARAAPRDEIEVKEVSSPESAALSLPPPVPVGDKNL
jgi:hypothetical protein